MTIGGVEYRSVVKNVQYWLVAMLGGISVRILRLRLIVETKILRTTLDFSHS